MAILTKKRAIFNLGDVRSMRANTEVRPYKNSAFPLGNSAKTWSRARQPQFNQWILEAIALPRPWA